MAMNAPLLQDRRDLVAEQAVRLGGAGTRREQQHDRPTEYDARRQAHREFSGRQLV